MEQKITKELISAFLNRIENYPFTILQSDFNYESKFNNLMCEIYANDTLIFAITDENIFKMCQPQFELMQKEPKLIFDEMKETHNLFNNAKPLKFDGITNYRLISEIGDVILAAKMDKDNEVRFTTWLYDFNNKGVCYGKYFETDYIGVKENFAIRAGLIDKNTILNNEQKQAIASACNYQLMNDETLAYEEDKFLQEIVEQCTQNSNDEMEIRYIIDPINTAVMEQER